MKSWIAKLLGIRSPSKMFMMQTPEDVASVINLAHEFREEVKAASLVPYTISTLTDCLQRIGLFDDDYDKPWVVELEQSMCFGGKLPDIGQLMQIINWLNARGWDVYVVRENADRKVMLSHPLVFPGAGEPGTCRRSGSYMHVHEDGDESWPIAFSLATGLDALLRDVSETAIRWRPTHDES